jgi:uncharacterized membrane protein
MKRAAYLFSWFELLGLAFWVGGMVTLGALVAPAVFDIVKPVQMAGDAMSIVFRKFNGGLVYVCVMLVAVGFTGKIILTRHKDRSQWIEGAMLLMMILTGLYIGAILGPKMQDLRHIRAQDPSNTGAVVEFDRGHRLSERLFTLNMVLGVGALFMNARGIIISRERNGDRVRS